MPENEIRQNSKNPQFKVVVASVPASTWFVFPTEIIFPLHDLLSFQELMRDRVDARQSRCYLTHYLSDHDPKNDDDIPRPRDEATANEIPDVSPQAQV